MKTMKKLLVVTLAVLALQSCEDAFDIVQDGEVLASEVIQNVDDLELALNGVYAAWNPENEIQFTAVFGDELSIGLNNGGQGISGDALYSYNLNANTGAVFGIWASYYSLIGNANAVIQAAERITPDPADQARYDEIVGVCHALRGHAHSQLMAYFSTDPSDDNALGVINVDEFVVIDDPENSRTAPRNTNAENAALIESDFTIAASLINGSIANADRSRVDQIVLAAMRARHHYYRGELALANGFAVTATTSGIAPIPDVLTTVGGQNGNTWYRRLWRDDITVTDNNLEVILQLTRTTGANLGIFLANRRSAVSGAPVYEMGREIYNELISPEGVPVNSPGATDIRSLVGTTANQGPYIDPSSTIDANYRNSLNPRTTDVIVVNKYPGNPAGFEQTNDIKVFRVTEMFMIQAEFQAVEAGNLANAAMIMDQHYARRLINRNATSYTSALQARQDIQRERRLEFWLEGHRYLDVKRMGPITGEGFTKDDIDCVVARTTATCDLPVPNFKFTLPIPQAELAGNPDVRGQQNPNF